MHIISPCAAMSDRQNQLVTGTRMNPSERNTRILPSDRHDCHPVPPPPRRHESGINSSLLFSSLPSLHRRVLRLNFLSCPLSLCGFRTVCNKRRSYRLLIFAVSSPQSSWGAVKHIQRQEDREGEYCSSMSNRTRPIASAGDRRRDICIEHVP